MTNKRDMNLQNSDLLYTSLFYISWDCGFKFIIITRTLPSNNLETYNQLQTRENKIKVDMEKKRENIYK